MIDFAKELAAILKEDPLGLLSVQPKASSAMNAAERRIAAFAEINAFLREHGREPTTDRDISERRLYSRLKGLRENPEVAEVLADYDEFALLDKGVSPAPVELNTVDDVLEHDILGLLDDGPDEGAELDDIFRLTHVPKSIDKPDYVAKRKQCVAFDQFEPLFQAVHAGLRRKEKVSRKFTSERQIKPGAFFLLDGMLVLVVDVGKREKRKYGKDNARLYCVFENGTESNMYLRSLAAALWKDAQSHQVIDAKQMELFYKTEQVREDQATGYIYVLRSLSDDPEITQREDLYKIGFSRLPVAERLKHAALEPTFLMAEVVSVAEFTTYDLNPHKLEQLIHTFFANACLELDVFDDKGKRHTPREWFEVPLHAIATAIELLINGEIVHYRYDHLQGEIVARCFIDSFSSTVPPVISS
ncbi:MAG: GIY-YIG nuclease family protein [Candidatus Electrothrix sp. AR3]|nr:GIY-YIG nuclease family protein [Candidatus Electrothrix sp. AR3]